MQLNDVNYIYIDSKIQDEFRNKLAHLKGDFTNIKCVKIGDSDFDYRLSFKPNESRVLNAPYRVNDIKYPLVYTGAAYGLNGYLTAFARKVTQQGDNAVIQSLYNYPTLENWSNGRDVPTLENGKDFDYLEFDNSKMGYILYFQSILYNYVDKDSDLLYRFNEKIKVDILINGQEGLPIYVDVVYDDNTRVLNIGDKEYTIHNNSIFISKDATNTVSNIANGIITITGESTNLTKKIKFNI